MPKFLFLLLGVQSDSPEKIKTWWLALRVIWKTMGMIFLLLLIATAVLMLDKNLIIILAVLPAFLNPSATSSLFNVFYLAAIIALPISCFLASELPFKFKDKSWAGYLFLLPFASLLFMGSAILLPNCLISWHFVC